MEPRSRGFGAAAVSGLALCLSFPDFSLFFLAWLALIPYLRFLLRRPSWTRTLLTHALFGVVYFGGVLYWIPHVLTVYGGFSWIAAVAVFSLLALMLTLFLLPFSLLTRWAAGRSASAALSAAPGFWLLTEWLRNYWAVDGFPWASLGYSQHPVSTFIQVADLGGVYLVGFLVVLVNCALASLLEDSQRRKLPAIAAAVLVLVNVYGGWRLWIWEGPAQTPVRAALIQPNIEQNRGREYFARVYFMDLPAFYRQAYQLGAEWVIFPEAPNPFLFEADFYFTTFWSRLVKDHGVPALINGTFRDPGDGERYNSAFLLDRSGRISYRYDKIHLVPFGEYLPWGKVLGFARPLVRGVIGFSPGQESRPGKVGEIPFGSLICYEAIFPELSRRAAAQGAGLLVNITNDSWFGRTAAPRQHLQMAAFRAVEQRKAVLRSANSGITAEIDLWGSIRQRLKLFEKGLLMAEAGANQYRTVYSWIGDWSNLLLIVISLLMAARAKP